MRKSSFLVVPIICPKGLKLKALTCLPCVALLLSLSPGYTQEPDFGDKTLSEWKALTKDNDAALRRDAVWSIGMMGPEAKNAVPLLMNLAKDKDAEMRQGVAEALGGIGPGAKDAIPVLAEFTKDADAGVRRGAVADALGRIGVVAIPALNALAKEKDPNARAAAAHASA